MIRNLIVLLTAGLSSIAMQAQDNGVPEIMNQESLTDKIARCRRIVYDAMLHRDTTVNVDQLLDYARDNYEGDGRVAFLLDEYRVIYLLRDRYHDFLSTIAGSDTAYFRSIANARVIGDMHQMNYATQMLYENKYKIRKRVDSCKELTKEQARFINIYIEWATSNADIDESVNKKCEQFMDDFPYSPYTTIIRSRIYEAQEPYQKFGLNAGMAYGVGLFSAGLTDIDGKPMLSLGLDVNLMYKRVMLGADVQMLLGKTANDLTNGGIVVPKRGGFMITNISLLAGYRFGLRDDFYVQPAIGANLPYMEYGISTTNSMKYDDFSFTGKWGKAFRLEAGRSMVDDKRDAKTGKYTRHEFSMGLKYSWSEMKLDMQGGDYNGFVQSLSVRFSYCMSRGRRK